MRSESLRRKSLALSYLEGSLYSVMVGSAETFAIVYAVKRGLSVTEIGFVSTLPILLGAIANWIVPMFVTPQRVKPSILACVSVQVVGIVGLVLSTFTNKPAYPLLISLSLYWIGGAAAGPIWLDWMSNWLPRE